MTIITACVDLLVCQTLHRNCVWLTPCCLLHRQVLQLRQEFLPGGIRRSHVETAAAASKAREARCVFVVPLTKAVQPECACNTVILMDFLNDDSDHRLPFLTHQLTGSYTAACIAGTSASRAEAPPQHLGAANQRSARLRASLALQLKLLWMLMEHPATHQHHRPLQQPTTTVQSSNSLGGPPAVTTHMIC